VFYVGVEPGQQSTISMGFFSLKRRILPASALNDNYDLAAA